MRVGPSRRLQGGGGANEAPARWGRAGLGREVGLVGEVGQVVEAGVGWGGWGLDAIGVGLDRGKVWCSKVDCLGQVRQGSRW